MFEKIGCYRFLSSQLHPEDFSPILWLLGGGCARFVSRCASGFRYAQFRMSDVAYRLGASGLGLIGFVFSNRPGVVFVCNCLLLQGLWCFFGFWDWVCFAVPHRHGGNKGASQAHGYKGVGVGWVVRWVRYWVVARWMPGVAGLRSEMWGEGDHVGSPLRLRVRGLGRGGEMGSAVGFLLGLAFVVRGGFCVGCFLFGARTLAGGRGLLRLRSLLVLFGRGLGRGEKRAVRRGGGLNLLGVRSWRGWLGGWLCFVRALRLLFGFGSGRLVSGAMTCLLCGLLGLIPLGLGGRVRRGGNLGGGRSRLGFL